MLRLLCFISLLSLVLAGCNKSSDDVCFSDQKRKICLIKQHDSLFTIVNMPAEQLVDTFKWELQYQTYQFLYDDITNDGEKEILVGVIKKTRFDSIDRKRVFIFKFFDNEIRPLWLGSQLGMPVNDFMIEQRQGSNYLKTIEIEKSGLFAAVLYEWDHFGFKFIEYISREKELHMLTE